MLMAVFVMFTPSVMVTLFHVTLLTVTVAELR